jgi:hypothetical protein
MIEILNRYTQASLYKSADSETLSAAIQVAVKERVSLNEAYLRGADLQGAYLQGAYLRGADLQGAYLQGAYLRGAYLRGAYLRGADLQGAYLQGAYLRGADLQGAYLQGAYLQGADLQGADLQGAYLQGAYLQGAYLQGAKGVNKFLASPLHMLRDQPGPIRAYKLVTAEGFGPTYPSIKYEVGKAVDAKGDTNESLECSHGINLASIDWVLKEWRTGYRILVVEFTAADIAAIPVASDGKFRVHRCTVVAEKSLEEVGLVVAPEEVTA